MKKSIKFLKLKTPKILFPKYIILSLLFYSGYGQNNFQYLINQNLKPVSNEFFKSDFDQKEHEDFFEFLSNDVKILSIGEAVHGSNELWEIQSKMAIHLAKNKGFKLIVLAEMGFITSLSLNAYIHSDIDSIEYYHYIPKDFFDTIKLINQSLSKEDKISIIGTDKDEKKDIVKYLSSVSHIKKDSSWISNLVDLEKAISKKITFESLNQSLVLIERLKNSVLDNNNLNLNEFSKKSIIQILDNLILNLRWEYAGKEPWLNRDNIIFKNIEWLYQIPGYEKMVIINSHNYHNNKITLFEDHKKYNVEAFGEQLSMAFGKNYYSIGTEVYSGKYGYNKIKEVVTPSNKLGTLIAKFSPLCNYGIFSFTDEICNKFDSLNLSLTFGTEQSTAFPIGSKICKAFDKIIFVRTIGWKPFYTDKIASFFLPLSVKIEKEILSKKSLIIKASTSIYQDNSSSNSNWFTVYFHDKDLNQIGVNRLIDLTKTNEIKIPKNAFKVSINWVLKDANYLMVNSLSINNKKIALAKLSFNDWDKNYIIKKEKAGLKIEQKK